MLDITKPIEEKSTPLPVHPKPENKADISGLQNLASQAKSAETEGAGFMQPGQKQKRGRGRPPKMSPQDQKNQALGTPGTTQNTSQSATGTPQPQAVVIPSKKIAEPAVKLLSKLGEGVAGHPKAAMTTEELDSISEAFGMVLDKWMPMVAGQYGPELYLCMALGAWGTRLFAIRKYMDELKKQAEDQMAQMSPQTGRDKNKSDVENISSVIQFQNASPVENPQPNGALKRPDMSGIDLRDVEKEFGPIPN